MTQQFSLIDWQFSENDHGTHDGNYLSKLQQLVSEFNIVIASNNAQLTAGETAAQYASAVQDALLIAQGSVMNSVTFDAIRENNGGDNIGSGFSEWGKHQLGGGYTPVNQGLYTRQNNVIWANRIIMGSNSGTGIAGVSRTGAPIVNMNGVHHKISDGNYGGADERTYIDLPPAPDGTKTYDSATGTVVQHPDSATAFAAETATNKVITSRQDYVFIESWHEKISDKDEVYYLGCVQSGLVNPYGITSYTRNDGYTRFGEWDSTTTGQAVVWSTLSVLEKDQFINDPDNNIYVEDGELIQVRYRIRVIEGLGDEWGVITAAGVTQSWYYKWTQQAVTPRGKKTTITDLSANTDGVIRSYAGVLTEKQLGLAECLGSGNVPSTALAYKGLCFAVPIALVQRRNTGAYSPEYNPTGTAYINGTILGSGQLWYGDTAISLTSRADAFNPVDNNVDNTTAGFLPQTGYIGTVSGRSDGKYYDAIYASDVEDLRMSSRRVPVAQIREDNKRKAIAGEVRGFDSVPFTYSLDFAAYGNSTTSAAAHLPIDFLASKPSFVGGVVSVLDTSNNLIITSATITAQGTSDSNGDYVNWDGDIFGTYNRVLGTTYRIVVAYPQTHKQANPTWTDIIGDPANILATFPNGVEGQWIPEIPTNTTAQAFYANRKIIDSLATTFTDDNRASWSNVPDYGYDSVTNSVSRTVPLTRVYIDTYETQAHFTRDGAIGTSLDKSMVVQATNSHEDSILVSSIKGVIPTSTDSPEELTITKTVDGVVSHTPESIAADILYSTQVESENGVAKLVFNVDDAGVIDGTNVKSTTLQYFIDESN